MKKMGMWIFVMALTISAGMGTYLYFGTSEAEASLDPKVEIDHSNKIEKAKETDSDFVELEPLMLPIVDKYGVSQVISLVVALEIEHKEYTEIVTKLAPKLKDAYIQDMYGTLSRQAALDAGVVQVSLIKTRLNKVTEDVLGKNIVNDVLLQVVQQRPI